MTRIAIAGGPRCGKTTFAGKLGIGDVRHTDDLIHLGWSEASQAASQWFNLAGPVVIEGVAVPRALRKWLVAHADGKPCDTVYLLWTPLVPITPKQLAMASGVETVWREIEPELRRRGVGIERIRVS